MYLVPVVAVEPQHHVDAYRSQQMLRNTRRASIRVIDDIAKRNAYARHYCPAKD